MRFRLATKPPLRPLRAWFDIPSDNSALDIQGLKAQICSRLPQLANGDGTSFSSAEIDLFIDDFELLDDSSLHVIKEDDLLHITRKQHVSNQKKRKAVNDHELARKKRHVHQGQTRKKPLSPSMSPTSTSTSSEDEESSSSKTSSSSEISSSDSESSSSDSSVEIRSSKLLQPVKAFVGNKDNSVTHLVPPGKGKPSTHGRNARRRVKRLVEKERKRIEQAAAQALPSGSTNAIPLETQKVIVQAQAESSGASPALPVSPTAEQGSSFEVESMVSTLRNKNKKRGFKRAMTGLTAQKIVFSEDTSAPPESTSTFYSTVSTMPTTPKATLPRLVTPSEKQTQGLIPSNMFVTSVEVEGESWDRTKKKKQRYLYGYSDVGDDFVANGRTAERDDTILNYGEPEVDWASIEQNWDNLAAVSDMSLLKVGSLVGWKALAINPATFSPETLVHLGRVKDVKHDSSSIMLEPIRRPGAGEIAFGAFSSADDTEDGEAKSETIGDELYTFEDALNASWMLVDRTG